ncbi:DUF4913 domain-containing protein [Nocardia vinacea]|uniref:DUF4913 domain-containing protein n=1 Tax=Nocardia vinacea TaxID=96468 RepID=UPI0033C76855
MTSDRLNAMGSQQEVRTTIYLDVVEFVENYLSLVYGDAVGFTNDEVQWCPEWWKHVSVVARLDALWRSWEHYRLDGNTGLSVWLLDHADPHMRELLRRDGPFRHCSVENGHGSTRPLPLKSPMPGLFRDPPVVRSATESG